jgi:hypothetical protein
MKIPTLLAGVALGAAAAPVAQITQEAIIKVSGNIDVRSPISVDSMPPLSFQSVPLKIVEIDDTVGYYIVPPGKRFRITYIGEGVGSNADHATKVSVLPVPGINNPYGLDVSYVNVSTIDGLIDTGLKLDMGDVLGASGETLYWQEGTEFEFQDWKLNNSAAPELGSPNAYPNRMILRGELIDA